MESYNEIKHRQLQTMLEPIRKQLKQYSPKTLCKNTMASFDENEQNFCLPSMGTDIFIHYPDFAIKQELDMAPFNLASVSGYSRWNSFIRTMDQFTANAWRSHPRTGI